MEEYENNIKSLKKRRRDIEKLQDK